MRNKKKLTIAAVIGTTSLALSGIAIPHPHATCTTLTLQEQTIARTLGWTLDASKLCGGYYIDAAFPKGALRNDDIIETTGNQLMFSLRGTSTVQGNITISRTGQVLKANRAALYRDNKTGKLTRIDMFDNVILRQPDNMVLAKTGHYDLTTRFQALHDAYYRTVIYFYGAENPTIDTSPTALKQARPLVSQGAWGHADDFRQTAPRVYVFQQATYSTCPPFSRTWQMHASSIRLDKNTGRGVATHARIYVHGIPVFYMPWINFPIDSRRQTGFLEPSIGSSSKSGFLIRAPFYWNMAPNYDMLITPVPMTARGLQLNDLFRYMTHKSQGNVNFTLLPWDREFHRYRDSALDGFLTKAGTDSYQKAEVARAQRASDTRTALHWQDRTYYNEHWFSTIDFNRVSDDYYTQDFSNALNTPIENQLLQQATLNYQSTHWNFVGNVQNYQTLHPVAVSPTANQYSRLPQLVLNGQWPNSPGNLDWFAHSELTHFTITPTPGDTTIMPTGNRLHLQPGVAWPYANSWLFFTPRAQFFMTKYNLTQPGMLPSASPSIAVPILDVHTGLYFDRDFTLAATSWRQTLEPELYYNYIPYRNQNQLPVFDTTYNTFTYDQLFTFNRFSGLDRISDANQISYGLSSRLINETDGSEKLRAGIGQILYFINRRVLLHPSDDTDPERMADNQYNRSPLAGSLRWDFLPAWNVTGNAAWNERINTFDNQGVILSYQPATNKTINLGYNYVRNGDVWPHDPPTGRVRNLSQTDLSFAWPVTEQWSTVGRWTQNWNRRHFQNLFYGLQYDTCCWAVSGIVARTFSGISANNTVQYDTSFTLQFALKGLGVFGEGNTDTFLSSNIAGYHTTFGQIT